MGMVDAVPLDDSAPPPAAGCGVVVGTGATAASFSDALWFAALPPQPASAATHTIATPSTHALRIATPLLTSSRPPALPYKTPNGDIWLRATGNPAGGTVPPCPRSRLRAR